MHGRVKTRTTEEQRKIAKREKSKKAKAYQDTMKIILEKRSSSVYDNEVLDLIRNLLTGNPDIKTLWNYRKEIFLEMKNEMTSEDYQQLLEKDLNLTEQCLRVNPKSYCTWEHRIWILDNLPEPNWKGELILCGKYLQLDERNFHCWDYRKIITQRSNVPDILEYNYTLEKIEANFSNYSAWHLRSKLLPKIFPDPEMKFPVEESKHKEELELVENAAFTDPYDQSAWFYLRWLLGLTEPRISFISAQVEDDNILIVFSKSLKLDVDHTFGVNVRVEVNGETAKGKWVNYGDVQSSVWKFKFEKLVEPMDLVNLILEENGVEYNRLQLQLNACILNKPNFNPTFSESLMKTLKNQFSSCTQLLELEPDSKWTLLTSIFLMLYIDRNQYETEIMNGLKKLCEIDSLRKNYYLDLRSKLVIESAITNYFSSPTRFAINNENLTCFYHTQYLYNCEEIDLSYNALESDALTQFNVFLNCKCLILSNNNIKSLKKLPILPKLKVLRVDNNFIEEVDWKLFQAFPMLDTLSLTNNPISNRDSSLENVVSNLSKIKLNVSNS